MIYFSKLIMKLPDNVNYFVLVVSSVPILIVLLFSDLSFMTNINQSFSDVQEVSQALMNMHNPSCESTMY